MPEITFAHSDGVLSYNYANGANKTISDDVIG